MLKSDSKRRRPGGPLPDAELWEFRVDQSTMGERGVRDPKGKYYSFDDGETFSMDRVPGTRERKLFIKTRDGRKIPVNEWVIEKEME